MQKTGYHGMLSNKRMQFRCIAKFTYLFLALFTSLIAAEEMVIPYTVENSCPFEGCSYGPWEVLKETPVYKETDVNSEILGTLLVGTKANIETGVSYIINDKKHIILSINCTYAI